MTGVKTATVEALTAEVRVLMVGSRQITLSVVRQLDKVDPEDIQPFGRVRAARQPASGDVEVVGSANGVLAYSVASLSTYRCSVNSGGNRCTPHHNALCDRNLAPWAVYGPRTRAWMWQPRDSTDWTRVDDDLNWEDHSWFFHNPDRETYQKWSELPLIVLAGLR